MAGLGTTEILIIAAILILLFGAKKLPDLARGSGRALRIFKSETKGMMDDEDKDKADPHGRPLPPGVSHTDAESHRQQPPQQHTPQPGQPPEQPVQPQSQDGAPRNPPS